MGHHLDDFIETLKRMKRLIGELAAENPHLKRSMVGALGNVHPRHLLDRDLQKF